MRSKGKPCFAKLSRIAASMAWRRLVTENGDFLHVQDDGRRKLLVASGFLERGGPSGIEKRMYPRAWFRCNMTSIKARKTYSAGGWLFNSERWTRRRPRLGEVGS